MSFHVFFAFSSGLSDPLIAPRGKFAAIMAHIEHVENVLGLKRTKYEDNPVHWDTFDPAYRDGFPAVDDKLLCRTVEEHNAWVRRLYAQFAEWSEKPTEDGEPITPEKAQEFWHGLQMLEVMPSRWTDEYYRARMEAMYEVMRGRESEGITFDAPKLSPKQAAAVIILFSEFLDHHDLRLDVPDGHDYLASSSDGGYSWCSTCGKPIGENDPRYNGCRRKNCELREECA